MKNLSQNCFYMEMGRYDSKNKSLLASIKSTYSSKRFDGQLM